MIESYQVAFSRAFLHEKEWCEKLVSYGTAVHNLGSMALSSGLPRWCAGVPTCWCAVRFPGCHSQSAMAGV